jgi:large subunit ribosomal protein L10
MRAGRPTETPSPSLGKEVKLNREDKHNAVAGLKEKFQKARGLILTDYKGMTVAEISELRDTLRDSSIEYRVVKNTLARIATEDTPVEAAKESFTGPVAVAMDYEDPARVAKVVLDFTKKNEKFKVTCGVIDGELCDPLKLKTISELPPRDVLLGMMAGTIQSPISTLAQLLSATLSGMAYALNALKDKKAVEQ